MDFYLAHRMMVDFSIFAVIILVVLMTFLGRKINNAEGNVPRVLVILVSLAISGFLVMSFEETMFFHWLFFIFSH